MKPSRLSAPKPPLPIQSPLDPELQALIAQLMQLLAQLGKTGLNRPGSSASNPLPSNVGASGVAAVPYYLKVDAQHSIQMDFGNEASPAALNAYLRDPAHKPESDGSGGSKILIPLLLPQG